VLKHYHAKGFILDSICQKFTSRLPTSADACLVAGNVALEKEGQHVHLPLSIQNQANSAHSGWCNYLGHVELVDGDLFPR